MKTSGILFGFIFLLLFQNTHNQTVTISGQDTSYVGDQVIFYKFSDQVTYTEKEIARTKVDEMGNYQLSFELDEITKVFTYLHVFNVYLYVEPGANYNIRIPPKTEKREEDKLNPYFEEFITPAIVSEYSSAKGTSQDEELNLLIRLFNDSYLPYYRKHAYGLVSGDIDQAMLENDIQRMSDSFQNIENVYFRNYMDYKLGFLQFLADRNNLRAVIESYFKNKPVLYNNPAYMELFNEVFKNHFSKIAVMPKGIEIKQLVGRAEFEALEKFLSSQKHLKKVNMIELIMLRSIYDGVYSGQFSRDALLKLLEELKNNTEKEKNKTIATNIKGKVTRLMSNQSAPGFELYDKDSSLVKLEDFEGKLVYLNFCNTKSFTCLNDFEIMKALLEKHQGDFEIISIVAETDFSPMLELAENKGYNWTILHYANQPKILSDYNIKAYPMYYILGADGQLIASPAPGPGENLEFTLFRILREMKR
jgi:hypothetical protein